jgi:glycosyltransferase involved in cell wall biosynthesis
MRIFLASYQSLNINKGGPTYKIKHMARQLQKMGIEVKLFDMWDEQEKYASDTDLFHIFNASVSTFPLANNLNLKKIKYVVNPIFFSNHKAATLRLYNRLDSLWQKLFIRSYSDYTLTKNVCEQAEYILPNTESESLLLQKGLGLSPANFEVIPNGVEERFYHADAKLFEKKYGIKNFILYVGHLGPYRKNGKNIIKALQRIDHPAVIIADVLNNKEGKWCREAIEKSKNIKLIEWLEHDDLLLESAYAASHTFILPTRYETPGRAALEAGLTGANIVITPKGGTREYFEDMVLYPNPDSVPDIVAKIETALNQSRSDRLKEHIRANYIWPIIAEQTKQIYDRVLEK